jgi:glycosyl transferase, family 25
MLFQVKSLRHQCFWYFYEKSVRTFFFENGMSIPVFVISLKSSSDRRASTQRQLEKAGINFSYADAVDGRTLSDEDIQNNPDFGIFKSGIYSRYLRKEEIGCTLSHLGVFRKMTDENIPMACILEDDNDYSPRFRDLLEAIEKKENNWDLLYLGHRSECTSKEAAGRKSKIQGFNDYFIGEPFEVPYGSHGYIITNFTARLLLEKAFPVKVPIDVYLGNSAAMGIRTMLLQPPCVISDPRFITTIQDESTIVVRNSVTAAFRKLLKKNIVIFGILKNCTIKFRILRNSSLRFLRKNGIIKNRYARILK